MKKQAIQYLALDVHQATVVATARDEHGSIRMRATVPTEGSAIVGLVRSLGRVHVAFEEGTQAQWLHDLLESEAEGVVVCNMRGRSETSNKSDRIDSDRLSEMLRLGAVKSVYHGARGMLTLKELVRCYTNLVEDSTRVMLRIKALFRARAILTPGTSFFSRNPVVRIPRTKPRIALIGLSGTRVITPPFAITWNSWPGRVSVQARTSFGMTTWYLEETLVR